jgi:hypothetical protein
MVAERGVYASLVRRDRIRVLDSDAAALHDRIEVFSHRGIASLFADVLLAVFAYG